MDLEGLLEEAGATVFEPVKSVTRGLAMLETDRPDVATLDMNLNGESSAPIAAALRERKIPFIVLTGYTGKQTEEPEFRDMPVIKKPFLGPELVRALVDLLA